MGDTTSLQLYHFTIIIIFSIIMDCRQQYSYYNKTITNSTGNNGSEIIGIQMLAGALTGILEHTVMFPIDSVKTRMQTIYHHNQNINRSSGVYSTLKNIIQTEGFFQTIRGLNMMLLCSGPAHALYFCSYEQTKKFLIKYKNNKETSGISSDVFIHGIAGCFATILHDAIMTPADTVKQRMQMQNSLFVSSLSCIRKMYKQEGLGSFYRSYTTQLTMNVPFHSLHFIIYEYMQKLINYEGKYNPKTHMISGAVAGAAAAAFITPLDVCKTLLNTQLQDYTKMNTLKIKTKTTTTTIKDNNSAGQKEEQAAIRGLRNAIKIIYKSEGLKGFFKGVTAHMIYQIPSTAITWTVYEFFKYFMVKNNKKL